MSEYERINELLTQISNLQDANSARTERSFRASGVTVPLETA